MKRALILIVMLSGVLWARAQQPNVRYFDENGNPVETEEGYDHDHDHEGHDHNEGHGDHSNESVRALFDGVSSVVAGQGGERVLHAHTAIAPRFGLVVQKELFAEVGLSLDFYRLGYIEASEYLSFSYQNLRPYISGEIMVGRKLLGGGKAGAEFIMSTPVLGMAVGLDGSYYTDGKKHAVTLTPRLVLSFVYVELYYGFNFFIRNELTRWIGHHRFGVSMTLNRGFWRRKKEVYRDYYDTYPESSF